MNIHLWFHAEGILTELKLRLINMSQVGGGNTSLPKCVFGKKEIICFKECGGEMVGMEEI